MLKNPPVIRSAADYSLEEIIKNIPWTQEKKWLMEASVSDEVITTATPIYATPSLIHNNQFYIGTYTEKEGLVFVPVGFSFSHGLFFCSYDSQEADFAWIRGPLSLEEKQRRVYLPMQMVPLYFEKDTSEKKKHGTLFHPYAVWESENGFPFVFLSEDADKSLLMNFFVCFLQSKAISMMTIDFSSGEASLRSYIASLEAKKYQYNNFPEEADHIIIEKRKSHPEEKKVIN